MKRAIICIFVLFLLVLPISYSATLINGVDIVENYTGIGNLDTGENLTGYFTLIGNTLCEPSSSRIGGCSFQAPIYMQRSQEDVGELKGWTGTLTRITINGSEYLFGNSSIGAIGNNDALDPNQPRLRFARSRNFYASWFFKAPAIELEHFAAVTDPGIAWGPNLGVESAASTTNFVINRGTPVAQNQSVAANVWYEILIFYNDASVARYHVANTTVGQGTAKFVQTRTEDGATYIQLAIHNTKVASNYDNMRVFNMTRNTENINTSANKITYKVFNLTSNIDTVRLTHYSNATGVEFWVSGNNGTTFTNLTNGTTTSLPATTSSLTVWINHTNPNAYNYFFNISGSISGADTTPPEITYYNLTSNNGCENWNTDKNNACSTSSVTPTVQFNTNENAWCAIAGSSSQSSLDKNYTDLGSSRNCTGAASGEGVTSHLCTLTNQDELVYDTSYLFISCKDSSNNQNRTSTSSALKVSVTGLEAARRNSIGIGIQNALLSVYTNYTDLQIYARNLSNAQIRGTFDRAAKKGSKIWAFNRIGVSDSHVNMFNMTPVLYTLEFANTTSARITNLTELMINATK